MKNPAALRERGEGSSILSAAGQPTRHRPGGPVIIVIMIIEARLLARPVVRPPAVGSELSKPHGMSTESPGERVTI